MMYPDSMRASDEDRQRVVDALQEQAGQGRLTLTEFDERSASAYAATTLGDLRKLTRDLPVDVLPLGTTPNAPFGGGMPFGASSGGLPLRPPQRETHPQSTGKRMLTTAAVVLLVMFLASTVVGMITHLFFFPIPLIVLAFVLMRFGGGHPGGPHGGPGYYRH